MELNEIIALTDFHILRVPGGWIYDSAVFVPFSDEGCEYEDEEWEEEY